MLVVHTPQTLQRKCVSAAAAAICPAHVVSVVLSVPQVEVESGAESVQLPFITTADLPGDVRVEWRDMFNWKVHVYQDGSDRPEEQDEFYRNRTEMKKDLLRTGDLSLTLKHLRYRGTVTYTCRVSREGRVLRKKQVKLWVKGQRTNLSCLGHCYNDVCLQVSIVSASASVLKWTDKDNRKVHVYQDGSDQPEEQDEFYRNRTEMKRILLKIGDFSLTLKHPSGRDTNTFTCRVYNREGRVLMEKQVELKVKGQSLC
uniref:Ig-like domain-containing protein n=1 Tax=Mastacembelus armatus TaxID=205130 RepID=A0A3Q3S109_9TELE